MAKLDVQIYGRFSCPYCVKANNTFEKLKEEGKAEGQFHDMEALGLTKEDVGAKFGIEVRTVPQVFVDGKHIGGCDDFHAWLEEKGYI